MTGPSAERIPQGAATLTVLGLYNKLPKTPILTKTDEAFLPFFRAIEKTAEIIRIETLPSMAAENPEACRELVASLQKIFKRSVLEIGRGEVSAVHQKAFFECCNTYGSLLKTLVKSQAEKSSGDRTIQEEIKKELLDELSIPSLLGSVQK